MEQVRPFNQSTAGKVPNLCLDNVTKGYGIPDKYSSAWEAWQHTQQHTDRNVPTGVDVPLFYSYTATIDGSTQNYGHINVRLANGTVWSDGNIYASIDAYLANHSPKYVGWGESVNDVTVIKGDEDMPTDKQIDDTINGLATIAYGPGGFNLQATLDNQRPLFKSNGYVDGVMTVIGNAEKASDSLKAQLDYARKVIADDQPGNAQEKLDQLKKIIES